MTAARVTHTGYRVVGYPSLPDSTTHHYYRCYYTHICVRITIIYTTSRAAELYDRRSPYAASRDTLLYADIVRYI